MNEIATDSPAIIRSVLARAGLTAADEEPRMTALTGGVSSDIWRVDLARGPVCVKRALPRLKVAQLWEAPIERNRYEALWMHVANAAVQDMARGKPSEIDHVDVTVACLRE